MKDLARRAAASRKGWESRRRRQKAMEEIRSGALAPNGPLWGSRPLPAEDMSPRAILDRIKARAEE